MFAERVPHGIIQSGNIDFVLNAPHYRHNGHSLGDGVEMETPDSRYSDERIEADVAAPNTLLNAALQFASIPEWTRPQYQRVLVDGNTGR